MWLGNGFVGRLVEHLSRTSLWNFAWDAIFDYFTLLFTFGLEKLDSGKLIDLFSMKKY